MFTLFKRIRSILSYFYEYNVMILIISGFNSFWRIMREYISKLTMVSSKAYGFAKIEMNGDIYSA